MKIGVIGLGKLGWPVALAIESKGHEVYGWDLSATHRHNIERKIFLEKEEGISDMLYGSKLKLRTTRIIVEECDIIFVAIQTPHDPMYEGDKPLPDTRIGFDYRALKHGVAELAKEAARQKKDTILCVISTVLPGTVDAEIKQVLNKYTRLCYNPFFIAMGTVIHDFLHPEFVLLGVDDKDAAKTVTKFYEGFLPKGTEVRSMSIASAECTKVSYNTFITNKICVTNAIGRLAHQTKGANADDVMDALKAATDRIVSPRYMTAGMGDPGMI